MNQRVKTIARSSCDDLDSVPTDRWTAVTLGKEEVAKRQVFGHMSLRWIQNQRTPMISKSSSER